MFVAIQTFVCNTMFVAIEGLPFPPWIAEMHTTACPFGAACVLVDWGRSLVPVAFGACGGSALVAWRALFCVFP